MTTTTSQPASGLLTYEQYMTEGHVEGRYSILDGVRIFMAGAGWRHQRIHFNINLALHRYEELTGVGYALCAPFDVLIRRNPLRTRQPDVLFITKARVQQGGGIPDIGPVGAPPEIVVEILSDSETRRMIGGKLADYASVGVEEGWLVRPEDRTVEVVRLAPDGPVSVQIYEETQTLQSLTFPDLTVAITGNLQGLKLEIQALKQRRRSSKEILS